jgi:hypothetical protein
MRNEVSDFSVHIEHVRFARVALILIGSGAKLTIEHAALLVERQVNALAGAHRKRELVQRLGREEKHAAGVDLVYVPEEEVPAEVVVAHVLARWLGPQRCKLSEHLLLD